MPTQTIRNFVEAYTRKHPPKATYKSKQGKLHGTWFASTGRSGFYIDCQIVSDGHIRTNTDGAYKGGEADPSTATFIPLETFVACAKANVSILAPKKRRVAPPRPS